MNAAIAQHLNVAENAIIEVQEWARVLWVRVRGIGARFVSKKVVQVKKPKTVKFGKGNRVAIATLTVFRGKEVYEIRSESVPMSGDLYRVESNEFLKGFTPEAISKLDVYEVI